jgi:hypothetical protein
MSQEGNDVRALIEGAGGKIEMMAELPDGHGIATASFPLPQDHWLYENRDKLGGNVPPMPFRMGINDPRRQEFNAMVRAAAQYAVRASTMNGRCVDFDPDAMVQNFVVGMLGYHSSDGLSGESWANPQPIPPAYPGAI